MCGGETKMQIRRRRVGYVCGGEKSRKKMEKEEEEEEEEEEDRDDSRK